MNAALMDGLPAAMHARLVEGTRSRPPPSALGVMGQRLFRRCHRHGAHR